MVRQRLRIRFGKEADLRLIGHLDLARTWERLFRRAGIRLRMSEGFHPKPRMSFPSALSVGISGANEVLEVEIEEEVSVADLAAVLEGHLPPGLSVKAVELLEPGTPPAQPARFTFQITIPHERLGELGKRIVQFQAAASYPISRGPGRATLDLRSMVESLELIDRNLNIHIRVTREGTARPRDVLAALGLDDLEQQGHFLTRTMVELEA